LEEINNTDLIQFDNKSISKDISPSFKPDKYFHLVTKECFDNFLEGVDYKEMHTIKYKFISKNKKLIAQSDNKIIVLFQGEENKLNLSVFILDENPIYSKFYDIIKDCSDIVGYLKKYQIDKYTKEKNIEIKDGKINYNIYYINKNGR
jgi:hypothetical protein